MRSDVDGKSICPAGQENHEPLIEGHPRGAIEYDYRHHDGQLFRCVAASLEDARSRCWGWAFRRGLIPAWTKTIDYEVERDI